MEAKVSLNFLRSESQNKTRLSILDFTAHFMQSRRSVGQPDTVMGTSINMNMYQAVL